MPSLSEPGDYELCLRATLEARGGRLTWGALCEEIERRYGSSLPGEHRLRSAAGVPRWQRLLEAAAGRMVARRELFRPRPDELEIV